MKKLFLFILLPLIVICVIIPLVVMLGDSVTELQNKFFIFTYLQGLFTSKEDFYCGCRFVSLVGLFSTMIAIAKGL